MAAFQLDSNSSFVTVIIGVPRHNIVVQTINALYEVTPDVVRQSGFIDLKSVYAEKFESPSSIKLRPLKDQQKNFTTIIDTIKLGQKSLTKIVEQSNKKKDTKAIAMPLNDLIADLDEKKKRFETEFQEILDMQKVFVNANADAKERNVRTKQDIVSLCKSYNKLSATYLPFRKLMIMCCDRRIINNYQTYLELKIILERISKNPEISDIVQEITSKMQEYKDNDIMNYFKDTIYTYVLTQVFIPLGKVAEFINLDGIDTSTSLEDVVRSIDILDKSNEYITRTNVDANTISNYINQLVASKKKVGQLPQENEKIVLAAEQALKYFVSGLITKRSRLKLIRDKLLGGDDNAILAIDNRDRENQSENEQQDIGVLEPALEVLEPALEVLEPAAEVLEPAAEVLEPVVDNASEPLVEPVEEQTEAGDMDTLEGDELSQAFDNIFLTQDTNIQQPLLCSQDVKYHIQNNTLNLLKELANLNKIDTIDIIQPNFTNDTCEYVYKISSYIHKNTPDIYQPYLPEGQLELNIYENVLRSIILVLDKAPIPAWKNLENSEHTIVIAQFIKTHHNNGPILKGQQLEDFKLLLLYIFDLSVRVKNDRKNVPRGTYERAAYVLYKHVVLCTYDKTRPTTKTLNFWRKINELFPPLEIPEFDTQLQQLKNALDDYKYDAQIILKLLDNINPEIKTLKNVNATSLTITDVDAGKLSFIIACYNKVVVDEAFIIAKFLEEYSKKSDGPTRFNIDEIVSTIQSKDKGLLNQGKLIKSPTSFNNSRNSSNKILANNLDDIQKLFDGMNESLDTNNNTNNNNANNIGNEGLENSAKAMYGDPIQQQGGDNRLNVRIDAEKTTKLKRQQEIFQSIHSQIDSVISVLSPDYTQQSMVEILQPTLLDYEEIQNESNKRSAVINFAEKTPIIPTEPIFKEDFPEPRADVPLVMDPQLRNSDIAMGQPVGQVDYAYNEPEFVPQFPSLDDAPLDNNVDNNDVPISSTKPIVPENVEGQDLDTVCKIHNMKQLSSVFNRKIQTKYIEDGLRRIKMFKSREERFRGDYIEQIKTEITSAYKLISTSGTPEKKSIVPSEQNKRKKTIIVTLFNSISRINYKYYQIHYDFAMKEVRGVARYVQEWQDTLVKMSETDKVYYSDDQQMLDLFSDSFVELNNASTKYFNSVTKIITTTVNSNLKGLNIEDPDDIAEILDKRTALLDGVTSLSKKIYSIYNNKYNRMDLLLDNQFMVLYVIKIVRILFVWISLYLTNRIFEQMYMKKVYTQNKDPPNLLYMLLIFLLIDSALNVFLLVVLLLIMYLFKTPSNTFIVNGYFIKKYITDYVASTIITLAIGCIIASVIQKKKYFRYKFEGPRGIRALQEMVMGVACISIAIPFFMLV